MDYIAGYEAGTLIADRYRVVGFLGIGAMGAVFEVADQQLNSEHIALKLLHPHLVVSEQALQRFRNETVIARKLLSPSIVRFFEFGETKAGQFYVTMELVDGVCLADILESGPLEIGEALDIIKQVVAGLVVAHSQNIVHRDIKPQNILITQEGVAKLTDFGTARLLFEGGKTLTRTGDSIGTPYYMSPEQFRGDQVDHRADIYSLGITLYETVTGVRPFVADTYLGVAMAHLQSPVPSVKTHDDTLPEFLDRIIAKACAKEAEQRHDCAEGLLEGLECHSSDIKSKESIAKNVYAKAIDQDQKLKKIKLSSLVKRRFLQCLVAFFILAFILPRVNQSVMMRMNIPFLRLHGTSLDKVARAINYFLYFPADLRSLSIFKGIKVSATSSRVYYGQRAKIRAGIDLDARDDRKRTPLILAYEIQQHGIADELLASNRAHLDAVDIDGRTALMILAIGTKYDGPIQRFLKLGPNVRTKDITGFTALHHAADSLNPQVAVALAKYDPQLMMMRSKSGDLALHTLLYRAMSNLQKFRSGFMSQADFGWKLDEIKKMLPELISSAKSLKELNNNRQSPLELMEQLYEADQKTYSFLSDYLR